LQEDVSHETNYDWRENKMKIKDLRLRQFVDDLANYKVGILVTTYARKSFNSLWAKKHSDDSFKADVYQRYMGINYGVRK